MFNDNDAQFCHKKDYKSDNESTFMIVKDFYEAVLYFVNTSVAFLSESFTIFTQQLL